MYWIVTDSAIDMPVSWIKQQECFKVLSLSYLMDGQAYVPDGTDEGTKAIYDAMRDGKILTTSQVNSETWAECFRELAGAGHDVLTIAFSSGLSGTCAAAQSAAEEVRAEFPERKLVVIDSLCASAGEGLLVHYALKNRADGMSFDDNAAWVQNNVQNIVHWFTVNDLMHLYRGGRVSATSAYIGTLARIKPIMRVDEAGKLAVKEKAAGRRRSIHILADKIRQDIVKPEGQLIMISHGDCADEAQALADMLKASLPVEDVQLTYVGPVIGAHTGPGVIAVFCLGESRAPKGK
ncbi:MAG: DegV family protein [Clostridia bacterium]|nr:DegV family protein [Clostridia bacterium]